MKKKRIPPCLRWTFSIICPWFSVYLVFWMKLKKRKALKVENFACLEFRNQPKVNFVVARLFSSRNDDDSLKFFVLQAFFLSLSCIFIYFNKVVSFFFLLIISVNAAWLQFLFKFYRFTICRFHLRSVHKIITLVTSYNLQINN